MPRILIWPLAILFLMVPGAAPAEDAELGDAPGRALARQAVMERERWTTADHSRFDTLNQEFKSGPEVTRACLSCHNESALQFHQTIHWTWRDPKDSDVGKGGLSINNFCINIQSNEPRCTSCHAGYGWKDKTFDLAQQDKVDCLVCHEQTGTYKKFPTKAGYVVDEPTVFPESGETFMPPNWNKVAQSVGRPTRNNCGVCHFYGGGGDGVKHGDMDSSMFKPSKALDVHMGVDGQNFDCVRCHTTEEHRIAGRIYATPAVPHRKSLIEDDMIPKIRCESCHGATPHKRGQKANDHTDKVACQSCHIPEFARVNPTKMWWDWSTAGKKRDGEQKVMGPLGKPSFDMKKGDFRWEKDVTPEYFWFNGAISTLTAKDAIDPTGVVPVSWPLGEPADPDSRIHPFKVHGGKQPYDKVNKTLLIPHLFGKKETGAFWGNFDWKLALEKGMDYAGLPFSGEYDFVETTYVFPTTHMVAPKEKALDCAACHSRQSRLAGITGIYMPGRDRIDMLDMAGWGIVLISLAGALLHGLGRIIMKGNNRKEGNRP